MISKKVLKELRDNFISDENNINRNRILNKTAFVDLVLDYNDSIDTFFNIEVKTHRAVDQKSTGRCWSFAGLNILRE